MRNKKLINARKKAGLNRVEFARMLNVNPTTLYRWEVGEYEIPFKRAKEIVGHLSNYGLKLSDLGYVV